MADKLKDLLDAARAKGASKEQLQGIVDRYKASETTGSEDVKPKGVQAEGNGGLSSPSADSNSSLESKQPTDFSSFNLKDFIQEQNRKSNYEQLKNSTPEELASYGVESVPQTYEEYKQSVPTLKEKLEKTPSVLQPKVIEEYEKNMTKKSKELLEYAQDYSKRKKSEKLYKSLEDSRELTDEEKSSIEQEYRRIENGDLTFMETLEAYTEGALNNPASLISPYIPVVPFAKSADREAIEKNVRETKRKEFFKELDDDDREALKTYMQYAPEGSKKTLEKLSERNNGLLKESAFLEDRILKFNDSPVYKEFVKRLSVSQEEANSYIAGLSDEEKASFINNYTKIIDLIEIQKANLAEFNSNKEDIQTYEAELDLVNRYYGLGENMAASYVLAWDNLAKGTIDTALDPIIAITKPEGVDYQQYREQLINNIEDSPLGYISPLPSLMSKYRKYLEEDSEFMEGKVMGKQLYSRFDPRYFAVLASEQLPNIVLIASGGSAGLGLMGTSVYGQKIDEYTSEDGEMDWKDRLAAGLSAGAEIAGERVTQGILTKGGRAWAAAKNEGKLSSLFSVNFGKAVAAGYTEEGLSETLTQIGQNYADIYIAGVKDSGMMDGVDEAFLDGGIMGGVMRAAPEIVGSAVGEFFGKTDELVSIRKTNTEINRLIGEALNPDLSDKAFDVIDKRIVELQNKNKVRVESYIESVESLSKEEVKDLTSIGESIAEQRKALTAIQQDETLSVEVKDALEKVYKDKIDRLHQAKNDLLENKSRNRKTAQEVTEDMTDEEFEAWSETATPQELDEVVRYTDKKISENKKDKGITYDVEEQFEEHKANGGSTFTLDGKNQNGQEGMASVATHPEREVIIKGDIKKKDLKEFVESNRDIFEGNEDKFAVGTWVDSETGETVLDIVSVMPIEEAKRVGAENNQKAIYDLGKGKEIKIKKPIKNTVEKDGTPLKSNDEYEKLEGKVSEASKGGTSEDNVETSKTKEKVDEETETEATEDITTDQEGEGTSGTGDVQATKQQFKKTANTVRKLKTNTKLKDGLSNLNAGVPKAALDLAWDAAVEAVAISIEKTGDIAQAIADGFNTLKKSDWYKSLSPTGKLEAESKFREEMNKNLSENTKATTNFKNRIKNAGDRVRSFLGQKFADKLFNLKDATKGLKGYWDFLEQDSVWQSKAAGRAQLIKDDILDIIKKAKKEGIDMKELSDWMQAKHAEVRNKYIQENINEDNPYGSGMETEVANKILNGVSKERADILDKYADKVYEIIEGTRKRMLESGLISQETYDKLAAVENYVPLTNFEDESIDLIQKIEGKSASVKGKEWKSAGGRTTRAGNILANVLMQATSVEIRAAKNEFVKSIYDLVKKNPEAGIGKVYNQKSLPKQTVMVNGKPSKRGAPAQIDDKFVGVKVNGNQEYIKFENEVFAKNINSTTDSKVGDFVRFFSSMNNYFRAVITTYNPEFMLSNFFRDLMTGIVHLQAQQQLNPHLDGKKIAAQATKDLPKAIREIAKYEIGRKKGRAGDWSHIYEEFIKAGGKTGWTQQGSYEQTVHELNKAYKLKTKHKAGAVLNYIDKLNTAVENGIRFSTYKAAREAGVSIETAASLAKELTVNFNRKGEAGTLLNAMYLFSNTAIQGTTTMYKNLAHRRTWVDENGKTHKGLTNAQKFVGVLTTLGALVPLMNRAIADEDEEAGISEYDKIPDFVKERNIVIMTGGKSYITIPLPYGYNTFYNLGEATSDVLSGTRDIKDASNFFIGSMLGSFSPIPLSKRDTPLETIGTAMIPTEPLKFTFEVMSNKDYKNQPIYKEPFPMAKGEVPDSQLPMKNTPQWAIWTTGLLNEATGGSEVSKGLIDINPETLIYTANRAGGGLGKFVGQSFSLGANIVSNNTGEPTKVGETMMEKYDVTDKKDIELHTIPFVRRFVGESQDSYFSSKYYEMKEGIYTELNVLKNEASKDGVKSVKELPAKEQKRAVALGKLVKRLDKAESLLKEIREKEKNLMKLDNRKDIQAGINAIDKKKSKIYKTIYKDYKEYKKLK